MTTNYGETVTTWADGFGIWHARVDFPAPGYGPGFLDQHIDRIRAKARRAIRREILAREAGPIAPVRVHVSANDLDSANRMRSLTFAEVSTAWESFYTSQDVGHAPGETGDFGTLPLPTWSVYREWFRSLDDEGEPWGQEYVSTHPDEASADAEAHRLYYAAHPERRPERRPI